MSKQDIRHFTAPNGAVDTKSFPVTAGQTFQQGEPVVISAAGTAGECTDDPSVIDGIAAHRSTDVNGTDLGVGTQITIYAPGSGQVFISRRFARDGAGTAVAPALTDVGDLAGFDLSGGIWSVDSGQDNLLVQITGVQDAAGNNLSDPNVLPGAGVWVLFEFI